MPATHFFSNPQDNLKKVKFYPFPLEEVEAQRVRSLVESHVAGSGCGQAFRQIPSWLPLTQVLGEDGELWMRPRTLCPPLGRSLWLDPRMSGDNVPSICSPLPGAAGCPQPRPALVHCSSLPEGPAPLTRHSSTQAASRTLPMLEDLDEGLTDEQEGILSFTALAMSINPRAQKHLSAAPTQPSSVIQRGGAVETLPQDSCSKG